MEKKRGFCDGFSDQLGMTTAITFSTTLVTTQICTQVTRNIALAGWLYKEDLRKASQDDDERSQTLFDSSFDVGEGAAIYLGMK